MKGKNRTEAGNSRTSAQDYSVYRMTAADLLIGSGAGFLIAAAAIWIFFRNFTAAAAAGTAGAVIGALVYRRYRIRRRKKILSLQFRDFLECLASSYSAGRNTVQAFRDADEELLGLHGESSDIVRETRLALNRLGNGLSLGEILRDFGKRSDIPEIADFADVISVCLVRGGDLRKAVSDCRTELTRRIDLELAMERLVSPAKTELYVLMCMPFFMMLMFGSGSAFSMAENSLFNILVKAGCLVLFGIAYLIGRRIVSIRYR